MGDIKSTPNVCPYSSINFFSRVSVWWLNPYFKKGYKQKFQSTDLYPIADKDQAEHVTAKLSKNWDQELERAKKCNEKPSFAWAFWKTFFWTFFINGFECLLTEVTRAVGPFFIGELSNYFVNPNMVSSWYPYLCAFGLTISIFLCVTFNNLALMNMQILGWNAKCAVIGLMYRKTLKLSHSAIANTTSGKIVNLSSTDALRFNLAFACVHYLWLAPLECAILAYILWLHLETAGFVGMLVLFLIMGIQTILGKFFGKLRLKTARVTDERVHVTNEVIAGMRIIKMYSWEKSFKELLARLRKKEMRHIFHAALLRSFNYTTKHSTTQILSFVTFFVFITLHGTLNLQLVLVSLGLFSVLLLGAGLAFPFAVEAIFQTFAALKRVQEFLLLPEIAPRIESSDAKPGIGLVDFNASWTKNGSPTLQEINVDVKSSDLLMVIGPVGAGKSSLLSAILGELPATSGKIRVGGKVAYSSQISWLFSDSVRNNILFGEDFDADKYAKVVRACALEQDFTILPSGDHTLVGERGVTLSGGQKARVSLARAVYLSDSDIIVMDDPLCAVDPSVADHLFQECICGLLKDKIRVLVTHQVQFLEKADQILILNQGRVVDQGSYNDLVEKGTDFVSLMQIDSNDVADDVICSHHPYSSQFSFNSNESICHKSENIKENGKHEDGKVTFSNDSLWNKKLVNEEDEAETKASGSIPFKVYYDYFNSGLHFVFFLILSIAVVGSHTLVILLDWWLAQWAVASQKLIANQNTTSLHQLSLYNSTNQPISVTDSPTMSYLFDQYYYLNIYAMMAIGYVVLMYIRIAMHYYLCVQSSVNLHKKMLTSVLRTKIRFFDSNPIGVILNRFSKDMYQVDERLPLILIDSFYNLGCVIAVVIFVISVNYFVIIMLIPLVLYLVWIRRYFVRTSREVKRIEGQDRSPVFSHLSSTLQGLITIRTFRVQNDLINTYNRLQDVHGSSWSFDFFAGRWFCFRLDLISALFISCCAFLSVIVLSFLPDSWPINPGNLGLTLTYSTSLLVLFQWGVRQSAYAENLMTSVERIQQYHKLPKESTDQDKIPPVSWPESGEIKFIDFSFSYYQGGPVVLKKINLKIKTKEKLGIVGRTGAGKSSLVSALFRMSDHTSGSIVIGGLDSSSVSLNDWRKSLTIIPQDPVLFGGSMRKNLDPFSLYTDEQLWSALEKVQLKDVVEILPMKLESILTESGSNLSVGQRQLVCLARAILRNNEILIIDEATANVDSRTDRLIQETIRKEFFHCTVLTVAHRLDTIIDSDRILVLSDGEILECDEPHKLLRKKDGHFTEMVKMTGNREADLRKAAEKAFIQRRVMRSKEKEAELAESNKIELIQTISDELEDVATPNENDRLL